MHFSLPPYLQPLRFWFLTNWGGSKVIQGYVKNSVFGNLSFLKFFLPPLLNYLIIFIEKQIFNIVHNEIIMQIYQNIKLCR
jgi:hypothetical protein